MSIWDDLDNEAYLQKNKSLKKVLIVMNGVLWVCDVAAESTTS
jgi:hypothetical protein